MNEAMTLFQHSLDGEALAYLESRGLGAVAVEHGLGAVAPGEDDPEWSRYQAMIAIPYYNANRDVTSIRFRTYRDGDSRPKYLQPPGSETSIYNLPAMLSRAKTVIICEGELDALAAQGAGYTAVGLPGANSWKPFYSRLFDNFDNVVVAGDPDPAGQEFNASVQKSIRRAIPMHLDKDIGDTLQEPLGFTKFAEAFKKAGGV